MDDYRRGGHSKYSLKVHIIFVTKYRRKFLTGILRTDVKMYFQEIVEKLKCNIVEIETDKDHVHILLEYKSSQSISNIVHDLKQYTTFKIWKDHPNALKLFYWKKNNLWSDGYFACSIGQVSQDIIEKYIQNQG